ncbi:MAG: hybrid sensor histidine kinase/response regulator [Paucimonas sp.]|nr:hybrid sensor histidine kinase/response regulator [Paucimonas sp.]
MDVEKNQMPNASRLPALLVVNDDPASLLGLTGLLDRWSRELGYEVVAANSGANALREVLYRDFAAILLDVNMPEMDGFETADIIHSRPASSSIPIIFVTAYWSDEVVRLKAYENGAVDYLFTPIVPEILKAKVSVFVGLAKKTTELEEQAALLAHRSDQLERVNLQLRREIDGRIEAERRDEEKNEFLAMLGHELRNPLAAITNAAGILRKAERDPGSLQFAAQVIQRQSESLNGIVDDLLNLGRVSFGKVSLDLQAADLAEVAESCVRTFELSGRTLNHELTMSMSSAWARIDLIRFEQIVGNLIDNALKYTPKGGRIEVRVAVQDEAVELQVSDSGIGIPADLLPQVFDTFVQGDNGWEGGIGIGLALVRQLVSMHGGTVQAISDGPGTGSRFIVRLPGCAAPQNSVQAIPDKTNAAAGKTVLLVDDNDDVRDTLAMVLQSFGCPVLAASGGVAALELIEKHRPEVALIDIGMPGMDGYEVARRIRADSDVGTMRLIAVTGYGTDNAARAIEAAGFDAHLTKPVRAEELLALVGVTRELRREPE